MLCLLDGAGETVSEGCGFSPCPSIRLPAAPHPLGGAEERTASASPWTATPRPGALPGAEPGGRTLSDNWFALLPADPAPCTCPRPRSPRPYPGGSTRQLTVRSVYDMG
jgi:hypothetical protein